MQAYNMLYATSLIFSKLNNMREVYTRLDFSDLCENVGQQNKKKNMTFLIRRILECLSAVLDIGASANFSQ
jgi:hypothetical protein